MHIYICIYIFPPPPLPFTLSGCSCHQGDEVQLSVPKLLAPSWQEQHGF